MFQPIKYSDGVLLRSMYKLIFLLIIVLNAGCSSTKIIPTSRPIEWAQKVELNGLNNFFKVDENLYRAEQPRTKDMVALQKFGIKTILNLRLLKDDKYEARETTMALRHVSVNTLKMSYDEILEAIKVIDNSEKPILIHCLHGSDRTGTVVAAYRIVKQGWTKEAAINEFKLGGFGYHEKWFPNLLRLLETLDIEKLKSDLDNSKIQPH